MKAMHKPADSNTLPAHVTDVIVSEVEVEDASAVMCRPESTLGKGSRPVLQVRMTKGVDQILTYCMQGAEDTT
jgi:hypothetical protein